MWAASARSVSVDETTKACARGIRDIDLRQRLLASRPELERNSASLQRAAAGHALHSVTPANYPVAAVSGLELKSIYRNQLGRANRPATKIRDRLISSSRSGLCCYCQHSQATTLDHFVPRDSVPTLAIDPWNLVPACTRCNKELLATYSSLAEEQMFHPYAMPDLGRWLHAEVVTTVPVAVRFFAVPADDLDDEIKLRLSNEFDLLSLGALFSVVSSTDISEMNHTLSRLFTARDDVTDAAEPIVDAEVLVRAHLLEAAKDAFRVDPNSRRGALFTALADDDEYCQRAFMETPPTISPPAQGQH